MRQFAIVAFLVIVALALLLAYDALVSAVHVVVWAAVAYVVGGPAALLAIWTLGRRQQHKIEMLKASQPQKFSAPPGYRLVIWEPPGLPRGNIRDVTLEAFAAVSPDGRPSPAWDIYERMHAGRNWRVTGPEPLALPEPTPHPLSVMDVIRNRGCYLVVGARNTGKTTLMRWLASERLHAGWQVLVIDPHNSPGKWPQGCHVVTVGEDEPASYEHIQGVLNGVVREMKRRFQQVRAGQIGEEQHPGLVVLVDEYMVLNYHLPAIADIFQQLLIESRKVSIDVVIGSHSKRVRSLGLDGKGDLIEGLVIVHLLYHRSGQREAVIEDQSGETPAVLPGEFREIRDNGGGWDVERPLPIELGTPAGPSAPAPNGIEARVVAMHREGASLRQIAREALGVEQPGKTTFDKIREIIERASE